MTPEEISEKIDNLMEQLASLKILLASDTDIPKKEDGVRCWACGGGTNPSTLYRRFYCRQENGPCGIIRIRPERKNKYDCDCSFQRMDTLANGEAGIVLDMGISTLEMFVISKGSAYNVKLIKKAMKGEL